MKREDSIPAPLQALGVRMQRQLRGEVRLRLADGLARCVVRPADDGEAALALAIANDAANVPVLFGQGRLAPSQQRGLKHSGLMQLQTDSLQQIGSFDARRRMVAVQPGVRAASLNRFLHASGLWLPVAGRATSDRTVAGLVATDAPCFGDEGRALTTLADHLLGVDAVLDDGTRQLFGPFGERSPIRLQSSRAGQLVASLFGIADQARAEMAAHWPAGPRAPGGYLLDCFHPRPQRPYTADGTVNLAHLLAGSRGTLAWFERLHLRLTRRPPVLHWVLLEHPSTSGALAMLDELRALQPVMLMLLDGLDMMRLRRSTHLQDARLWQTRLKVEDEGRGIGASRQPGPEQDAGSGAGWLLCLAAQDRDQLQQQLGRWARQGRAAKGWRQAGGGLPGIPEDGPGVPEAASGNPKDRGQAPEPLWPGLLDEAADGGAILLTEHVSARRLDAPALLAALDEGMAGHAGVALQLPALRASQWLPAMAETEARLRESGMSLGWRGMPASGEWSLRLLPLGRPALAAGQATTAWRQLLPGLGPWVSACWTPALQQAFAQVRRQFDPKGLLGPAERHTP